ncbi:MAG: class I SAM-dependent methyltransferase [Chitinophagales bacterium]
MKCLFVFLLLSISLLTNAQDWESKKKDLIKELSIYRASLMQSDVQQMALFALLLRKWDKENLPEKVQSHLLLKLPIAANIHHYTFEDIALELQEHFSDFDVIQEMTREEVNAIINNSDLIDLIRQKVLKKDYPFAIKPKNKTYEELAFYDIQQNEVIGEIGAGNGAFSILLALLDKDIKLYINEIEKDALSYIRLKLGKNEDQLISNRIHLIQGDVESTKFEDNTMDKIIMRNTFHHFDNRKSMLNSIKKALKKEGELYIYETLYEFHSNKCVCSKLMTEKKIKRVLEKSGFILEKELILGQVMIMKYTVTPE